VVEMLLKARGQWPDLVERHFTEPVRSGV
jgi:hypothetical protein